MHLVYTSLLDKQEVFLFRCMVQAESPATGDSIMTAAIRPCIRHSKGGDCVDVSPSPTDHNLTNQGWSPRAAAMDIEMVQTNSSAGADTQEMRLA